MLSCVNAQLCLHVCRRLRADVNPPPCSRREASTRRQRRDANAQLYHTRLFAACTRCVVTGSRLAAVPTLSCPVWIRSIHRAQCGFDLFIVPSVDSIYSSCSVWTYIIITPGVGLCLIHCRNSRLVTFASEAVCLGVAKAIFQMAPDIHLGRTDACVRDINPFTVRQRKSFTPRRTHAVGTLFQMPLETSSKSRPKVQISR